MMSSKWVLIIGSIIAVFTVLGLTSLKVSNVEPSDSYHERNGWKLIWSDEFEGEEINRSKWTPETSCWGGGNNERQCYTDRDDNIEVGDGVLRLTAKPEEFSGLKYPQDWSDRGNVITQKYTSGKLRTKGLRSWTYGRFEARIKLPAGQSTWPAFWMLPEDSLYGDWPLSGEIDIMEAVNLGEPCKNCENSKIENRSSVALHFGQPWPENQFVAKKNPLPNGNDSYHIFALEWSKGQMDWFVDKQKVLTMTQNEWFTDTVSKDVNALAPFDKPFYLALNLAVGGNLPDNYDKKNFDPESFPDRKSVV